MNRFDPSRFAVPALAILSLMLLAGVVTAIVGQHRSWKVTVAAGGRSGESYVLAQALKIVAQRRHPDLTVAVRETGGTAENLELLEKGEVDFATAQADAPQGRSARLVANLFGDAFQLLVRKESSIRSFAGLAGKRISLPTSGGQFQSFLSVAEHFGFSRSDFVFVEGDESGAAFLNGNADALFRVRALGNPTLIKLAREGRVRPVPIEQAAAMRIRTPAFQPSVIPQGAYLGNPPIPESDIATVTVQRTLLARADIPDRPVIWLTATLFEDRDEIARAIPDGFAEVRPLLASISKPDDHPGLGGGLHPGAQQYYDKDKPSFLVTNADFFALVVTLVLLGGSWLWELRQWLNRKQKNRADGYNHEILALYIRAEACNNAQELMEIRQDLLRILALSVNDLDLDRISSDAFQSLRVIWQITVEAVREKHSMLTAASASR